MKELVYVIGLSKFGASIASTLSEKGKDVVVIDIDEKSFQKLDENFGGMKLVGDALDLKYLENAEMKKATKVIIALRDDNANIFLSNVCDALFKIPSIYVRLNKRVEKCILHSDNIKPVYPFQLSIDYFFKTLGDKS